MDDFKDSTKTQYAMGGAAYAKGGSVKGAAKVSKVMGEFKSGQLHSGSKTGPKVTSRKQATAIAVSEARKAGVPVQKKSLGGILSAISPVAAIASGKPENLLTAFGGLTGLALQQLLKKKETNQPMTPVEQKQLAQAQQQQAAAPVAAKKGGMIKKADGGAVARGNRMSAEEAAESRLVRKPRPAPTPSDAERRAMRDTIARGNRVSAEEAAESRLVRRGVPAHRNEPMINRKHGGLAVMPKGKKC
jgi:hypothetical protein